MQHPFTFWQSFELFEKGASILEKRMSISQKCSFEAIFTSKESAHFSNYSIYKEMKVSFHD